jgi:integrase
MVPLVQGLLLGRLPPMGPVALRVHRSQSWRAYCAYTGARVGELTQLRAGDVQARHGPAGSIWVLHLTPDAGTIKTGRARAVPLHADLVRQGFPEFARRALAALGQDAPLFFKPPREPSRPQLPRTGREGAGAARRLGA